VRPEANLSPRWGGSRSAAGWSRSRRTGGGRAIATIKRECAEPWRLNQSGRPGTEAGSCPSGCAAGSSALPPRSPRARDRGHPRQDRIPLEIGATNQHFSFVKQGHDLPTLPSIKGKVPPRLSRSGTIKTFRNIKNCNLSLEFTPDHSAHSSQSRDQQQKAGGLGSCGHGA